SLSSSLGESTTYFGQVPSCPLVRKSLSWKCVDTWVSMFSGVTRTKPRGGAYAPSPAGHSPTRYSPMRPEVIAEAGVRLTTLNPGACRQAFPSRGGRLQTPPPPRSVDGALSLAAAPDAPEVGETRSRTACPATESGRAIESPGSWKTTWSSPLSLRTSSQST